MAKDYFDITVDEMPYIVSVYDAENQEIKINNSSYVVPSGVVCFIKEMAHEIEAQQKRRVATDKEIDDKINKRVDRMLKALDNRCMLADHLTSAYALPAGMEVDGGTWTFADEARNVCRKGLQNEYNDDLVNDIGDPNGVLHRKG